MCSCCPTAALLTMRRAMRPNLNDAHPCAPDSVRMVMGGPFVVAAGLGEIGGEERAGVCCAPSRCPKRGRAGRGRRRRRNVETRGRGSLPSPSSGGGRQCRRGRPHRRRQRPPHRARRRTRPGWRKKAAHAAVRAHAGRATHRRRRATRATAAPPATKGRPAGCKGGMVCWARSRRWRKPVGCGMVGELGRVGHDPSAYDTG